MSGTDTVSTKIKDKRICFLEKQTGEKKKKKKRFRSMKKRKNPRKVRFTESPSFSTAFDFFFGRILMKRSRLGISRKNAEKERGNQNARDFPGKRERK